MKVQLRALIIVTVLIVGFLSIQGIVNASSPGPVVDLTTGQYNTTIQSVIAVANAGDTIQVAKIGRASCRERV